MQDVDPSKDALETYLKGSREDNNAVTALQKTILKMPRYNSITRAQTSLILYGTVELRASALEEYIRNYSEDHAKKTYSSPQAQLETSAQKQLESLHSVLRDYGIAFKKRFGKDAADTYLDNIDSDSASEDAGDKRSGAYMSNEDKVNAAIIMGKSLSKIAERPEYAADVGKYLLRKQAEKVYAILVQAKNTADKINDSNNSGSLGISIQNMVGRWNLTEKDKQDINNKYVNEAKKYSWANDAEQKGKQKDTRNAHTGNAHTGGRQGSAFTSHSTITSNATERPGSQSIFGNDSATNMNVFRAGKAAANRPTRLDRGSSSSSNRMANPGAERPGYLKRKKLLNESTEQILRAQTARAEETKNTVRANSKKLQALETNKKRMQREIESHKEIVDKITKKLQSADLKVREANIARDNANDAVDGLKEVLDNRQRQQKQQTQHVQMICKKLDELTKSIDNETTIMKRQNMKSAPDKSGMEE